MNKRQKKKVIKDYITGILHEEGNTRKRIVHINIEKNKIKVHSGKINPITIEAKLKQAKTINGSTIVIDPDTTIGNRPKRKPKANPRSNPRKNQNNDKNRKYKASL